MGGDWHRWRQATIQALPLAWSLREFRYRKASAMAFARKQSAAPDLAPISSRWPALPRTGLPAIRCRRFGAITAAVDAAIAVYGRRLPRNNAGWPMRAPSRRWNEADLAREARHQPEGRFQLHQGCALRECGRRQSWTIINITRSIDRKTFAVRARLPRQPHAILAFGSHARGGGEERHAGSSTSPWFTSDEYPQRIHISSKIPRPSRNPDLHDRRGVVPRSCCSAGSSRSRLHPRPRRRPHSDDVLAPLTAIAVLFRSANPAEDRLEPVTPNGLLILFL